MKDLITTISSIMILTVFVMQFCSNQVLSTKILLADTVIDKVQREVSLNNDEPANSDDFEEVKMHLASCFDCTTSDVVIIKNQEKIRFDVPIKNVVPCSEFLGIDQEHNCCTYTREVLVE